MSSTLTRRSFLKATTATTLTATSQAQDTNESYDLIISGGTVIDPSNEINKVTDIGIQASKIIRVADSLPRNRATRILDAKGLYVSPGWIDLHAHVFFGSSTNAVHPDKDAGVHAGVTTIADPGGFRASEFHEFRRTIIDKSVTRVRGFVNAAAYRNKPGTPGQGSWELFDQQLTIKTIAENKDVLKGVKVLSSNRHAGNLGITPTKLAVQAARETGTHVVAHIGMAPPLIQEVLNLLGPGDIVTHCFKGYPMGIFHSNGRPVSEAWKALERGIRFDLGHGQGSFAWEAGRNAKRHNFPLHSLSTDIHQGNIEGPIWTYGRTMAKFLHLGYSLPDVIRTATLGPAELIDEGKDLGSLSPGTVADLTIFRVLNQKTTLTDSLGNSETGDRDIQPAHCIRAGQLISDMKAAPAA